MIMLFCSLSPRERAGVREQRPHTEYASNIATPQFAHRTKQLPAAHLCGTQPS